MIGEGVVVVVVGVGMGMGVPSSIPLRSLLTLLLLPLKLLNLLQHTTLPVLMIVILVEGVTYEIPHHNRRRLLTTPPRLHNARPIVDDYRLPRPINRDIQVEFLHIFSGIIFIYRFHEFFDKNF